jgi:hypothetical protein
MWYRRFIAGEYSLWAAGAAIVITGLVAYGWSVSFDVTGIDDSNLFAYRQQWLQSWTSIPEAFHTGYWHNSGVFPDEDYYRPLVTLTFIADAIIGRGSLVVPHVTNVLIHCAVAFMLFVFLQQLGTPKRTALILALLFAAHPLASNAVSWIPGRNDSLCALFLLLSFITAAMRWSWRLRC